MSLVWRLCLWNALLVVVCLLTLYFSPLTLSYPPTPWEDLWLALGGTVAIAANVVIVRRSLRPLTRLAGAMRDVSTPRRSGRVDVEGADEVATLARAYNAMLDRLDAERADVARATLMGQEDERRRVAGELHDEVGQSLTVVLLQLARLSRQAPAQLREDLAEVQEATRSSLDVVRAITTRLRPGVLDDLGLSRAITDLAVQIGTSAGLTVHREIDDDLRAGAEQDLVLYRVAQEALTNAARHARAGTVRVILRSGTRTQVVLEVIDDGRGLPAGHRDGNGLTGMRERARLVQGTLSVGSVKPHGTRVRLVLG